MARLVMLAAVWSLAACSDEDDYDKQNSSLLNYVTGTLKLVTQEEAMDPSSEKENPNFYTTHGSTVYRWITNYYDEERRDKAEVKQGSLVEITYSIYTFSGNISSINDRTLPFYTNDEEKRALLENAGLNTEYWDFAPLVIRLGETPTIKGLALALEGCREGDVVQIYMTYNMAYGEDWFSTVEPDSPVAIYFTIDSVE